MFENVKQKYYSAPPGINCFTTIHLQNTFEETVYSKSVPHRVTKESKTLLFVFNFVFFYTITKNCFIFLYRTYHYIITFQYTLN